MYEKKYVNYGKDLFNCLILEKKFRKIIRMPYLARFENKATSHPPIPSREKFLKIRNGFK